jgi:glycine/D-amino acid oxidase-like deaminating enzyme
MSRAEWPPRPAVSAAWSAPRRRPQPLGYARGLAEAAQRLGARIHGGSPVTRITQRGAGWQVATAAGSVATPKVLIGTNAYTTDFWPGLAASVVPVSSFQVATAPLTDNLRRTILPEGHVLSTPAAATSARRGC